MRICFFCKIEDKKALDIVDFYKQDILALKEVDPDLTIATSYKQIDFKADVIFVWWWTYAIYPVLISRLLRKKVIITGTFNYKCPKSPIDYFRRPWYHRLLIKWATKLATKNVLVSKHEYELLTADWKLNNTIYSPHGINTDLNKFSLKGRENILFSMIWTGKVNLARKSLPEIIEAAVLIKKEYPNFKILIGGRKGDGFDAMNEKIKELNLDDYVILLGELTDEEKVNYYQTCKLYLQPSTYEGFGVALAEAMSCGTTVISTKVGEVENVVGDAGILLDGNHPEEIFGAVNMCLKDDELREDLGRRAAERIRNKFSEKNRRQTIIEVTTK